MASAEMMRAALLLVATIPLRNKVSPPLVAPAPALHENTVATADASPDFMVTSPPVAEWSVLIVAQAEMPAAAPPVATLAAPDSAAVPVMAITGAFVAVAPTVPVSALPVPARTVIAPPAASPDAALETQMVPATAFAITALVAEPASVAPLPESVSAATNASAPVFKDASAVLIRVEPASAVGELPEAMFKRPVVPGAVCDAMIVAPVTVSRLAPDVRRTTPPAVVAAVAPAFKPMAAPREHRELPHPIITLPGAEILLPVVRIIKPELPVTTVPD